MPSRRQSSVKRRFSAGIWAGGGTTIDPALGREAQRGHAVPPGSRPSGGIDLVRRHGDAGPVCDGGVRESAVEAFGVGAEGTRRRGRAPRADDFALPVWSTPERLSRATWSSTSASKGGLGKPGPAVDRGACISAGRQRRCGSGRSRHRSLFRAGLHRGAVDDQPAGDVGNHLAPRLQPVRALQGRAGLDEVDDEARQAEPRGELHGAVEVHNLGMDAAGGEMAAGDIRDISWRPGPGTIGPGRRRRALVSRDSATETRQAPMPKIERGVDLGVVEFHEHVRRRRCRSGRRRRRRRWRRRTAGRCTTSSIRIISRKTQAPTVLVAKIRCRHDDARFREERPTLVEDTALRQGQHVGGVVLSGSRSVALQMAVMKSHKAAAARVGSKGPALGGKVQGAAPLWPCLTFAPSGPALRLQPFYVRTAGPELLLERLVPPVEVVHPVDASVSPDGAEPGEDERH